MNSLRANAADSRSCAPRPPLSRYWPTRPSRSRPMRSGYAKREQEPGRIVVGERRVRRVVGRRNAARTPHDLLRPPDAHAARPGDRTRLCAVPTR
jgi:hypothetical protein